MDKKKIIFFNPTLTGGGAERLIVDLLKSWPKDDSLFVTLVLANKEGVFLSQVPKKTRKEFLSRKLTNGRLAKLVWFFTSLVSFVECINKEPPKVILTFVWPFTLIAVMARMITRRQFKVVWHLGGGTHMLTSYWLLNKLFKPIILRILIHATDFFIAVSSGTFDKFIILGIPKNKMALIYNGADIKKIISLSKESGMARQKRFPIRIISAGRLSEQKGFDLLIDAFVLIKELPVELIILGEGDLKVSLEKKIKMANLQDRILLPGFSRNPFSWFSNADIFVSSAHFEPFGLVILEAMACGLSVIATNTSGAKDLIENGKNGFLVPVESPDLLATALKKLILDPALREKMRREGRLKSFNFDIHKTAQEYYKVIKKYA